MEFNALSAALLSMKKTKEVLTIAMLQGRLGISYVSDATLF